MAGIGITGEEEKLRANRLGVVVIDGVKVGDKLVVKETLGTLICLKLGATLNNGVDDLGGTENTYLTKSVGTLTKKIVIAQRKQKYKGEKNRQWPKKLAEGSGILAIEKKQKQREKDVGSVVGVEGQTDKKKMKKGSGVKVGEES